MTAMSWLQGVAVAPQSARRQGVGGVEDLLRIGFGHGLGRLDGALHLRLSTGSRLRDPRLVEHSELPQPALEATETLSLAGGPELRLIHVAARVVRGGMGRGPEADRLDELRALSRAGARRRLPDGVADREGVGAVDTHALDSVAGGLVDQPVGAALLGGRGGDRPRVVVADEHR